MFYWVRVNNWIDEHIAAYLYQRNRKMPLKYDDPKIKLFDIPTPEGVIPVVVRMIESSNIKWVGWPEKPVVAMMFVEFMDGSRYVYFGVTRQRATHAAYAKSTGSYLNQKIKGKYEYLKLR